jgi:Fe-S-cluster-containing hydrogenase component 2
MPKQLVIDYDKCVGCRTCEMACSIQHEKAISPSQSRISIVKWDMEGQGIPITCAHCESAPCASICPVGAVSRDGSLGRVTIDYERCIGCRMCIAVCPFGAMAFDKTHNRVFKCDLCDGDPLCVRFCVYGALRYAEVDEHRGTKQRRVAERLKMAVATRRVEVFPDAQMGPVR